MNWAKYSILITSTILFLCLLPLVWSIDFMQNDDWNRYQTVSQFLNGDFKLLEVTATTFYTQGFIGMGFANVFPLNKLPVLTLFFGVINFALFSLICNKFFKLDRPKSILVGLILFFNPLHFYSLLGFMTEVYLVAFCLASIYFYLAFLKENRYSQFILANVSWILAFFAKQWGIVFSAAFLGHQILRRKWKVGFYMLLILLGVLAYYYYFFPRTYEMAEQKSFETRNYESLKYILTHGYAYFIYLCVFSLPFVWQVILQNLRKINHTRKVLAIIFAVLLSKLVKFAFDTTNYPWKTFPLFPNIFTEKGFFLSGIEGQAEANIYAPFIGLLDEVGLFSLALLGLLLLFRKKLKWELLNMESIGLLIGYFLLVGTPFIFDRYILVLIPFSILFLIRLANFKINIWFVCAYLLVQSFISVDYGAEYISRGSLVWHEAERIHQVEKIPREEIIASHAWNKFYKLNTDKAVYWFRYSDLMGTSNELVTRKFWSRGILTRINLDVIRVQDRH